MDISSDKLSKLLMRRPGHGLQKKKKKSLHRETGSLLIAAAAAAAQNVIMTIDIEAGIDYTQRNRMCRLCGDRDETINRVIKECNKVAKKTVTMTLLKNNPLYERLNVDHAGKWYIYTNQSQS